MTNEKESSDNQGRSLIVPNSQQIDLAGSETQRRLQAVNFSPNFPQKLMRLNDALRRDFPAIRKVSLTLIPGTVPQLDAMTTYKGGYMVEIESDINGNAALHITSQSGTLMPLWTLPFKEIKSFASRTFPDRKAYLQAKTSSEFDGPPLNMDLNAVKPGTINTLAREYETSRDKYGHQATTRYERNTFQVSLEGMEPALFSLTFMSYPTYGKKGTMNHAFHIKNINYEGKTPEVERVLDSVSDLLTPEGQVSQ